MSGNPLLDQLLALINRKVERRRDALEVCEPEDVKLHQGALAELREIKPEVEAISRDWIAAEESE